MYAGTQKAASSWLHAALRRVEGLAVARKEWHVWDLLTANSPAIPNISDPSARPRTPVEFAEAFESISAIEGDLASLPPRPFWPMARLSGAVSGDPLRVAARAVAACRGGRNALEQWADAMLRWDVGDFTPDNVVLTVEQWSEIAAVLPDLTVVVGVRDPSRRAWSALSMYMDRGWLAKDPSPEEALRILAAPLNRQRSLVSATVRSVQRAFGADRVVLVAFDDVCERPSEVLGSILERLGRRSGEHPPPGPANVGSGRSAPPSVMEALDAAYSDERALLQEMVGRRLGG